MKSSYIEKYINLMSTSSVRKRGEALFAENAVKYKYYNKSTQEWTFKVQGSNLYTVSIHDTGTKIFSTSCNCPYDWHGICKHTVAALMSIEAKDKAGSNIVENKANKKNENKVVSKFRLSDNSLKLSEYRYITEEYIRWNYDKYYQIRKELEYFIDDLEINIDARKIKFKFKYLYKLYTVEIFKKKQDVYIKSNEKANIYKNSFTSSEALCLLMIARSDTPDMLETLFDKDIKQKEKEIIKTFDLPENTNFNDFFEYIFDKKSGLSIIRKEKAIGLVSLSSENDFYIDTLNSVVNEELSLPKLIKKEKRDIGFVINIDYEDSDIEIFPIIGKTNKKEDVLHSKIELYHSEINNKYLIEFTENQKSIMDLNHDIDYFEKDNDELVDKDLFKYVINSFKLLSKEKFVFLRENDATLRIVKKDLQKVRISENTATLLYKVEQDEKFIQAKAYLKVADELFDIKEIRNNYNDYVYFINIDNTLYAFDSYQAVKLLVDGIFELKAVKEQRATFYEKIIYPLSKYFEVEFEAGLFNYEIIELDFSKKQIFLSEKDDYIIIKPQVIYGDDTSVILNYQGDLLKKENGQITIYKRNFELENDFINQITELHPNFKEQEDLKIFYIHFDDFTKNMWFFKFFERMQQLNVELFGLKDLKNFKYSPYKGKITTSIKSGQDWFDVDVQLLFGDQSVTLNDIRKAIVNKQNYVLLKDGSVGILPKEWLHKLEKYFRNGEISKNKLKISKLRFSIIDELFEQIDDSKIIKELSEKRKLLSKFKEIEKVKVPKSIKATLRDYQKEGLNWLNFLDKMKWGGILADDMGLGKTLQILSFLQSIKNKSKKANLIVVPTTLLFNWQKEIEKFSPNLKALYYYGTDREKNTQKFDKYDIVFVTYGILLRDIEVLKEYQFNYMILDESQAIKNPASRRYKAAVLISAKNKLALTGTPIENSTFDLFAQINFTNPGMLGSLNNFRENYSNPIDKEGNELVAEELQKIINPFVLRRTKEQVATELPPKVEDIIYCEMETEQRKVYDAFRNSYRDKLLNKIEKEGMGKSKFMVLEALTRLRQICDSPALLKDDEVYTNQSIKIKEIINHITDKTANHKILIFSQFVEMLSLLKEELNKRNIDFEYLDGKSSTKQRENSVNNFQTNNNLRVFLISLKAGGTGLNLTAADYVYIMDPWWNPAVENQAIDRCYRIGQDKHVFAYRMICKNTIEEKIMNLQAKKQKIAKDIIQTDEKIMKTIDVNDIKELFA